MCNEDKRVCGIQSSDDNLFLNNNVIAIEWSDMENGITSMLIELHLMKNMFRYIYTDKKTGSNITGAGMLFRFRHEVRIADYLVCTSKNN